MIHRVKGRGEFCVLVSLIFQIMSPICQFLKMFIRRKENFNVEGERKGGDKYVYIFLFQNHLREK